MVSVDKYVMAVVLLDAFKRAMDNQGRALRIVCWRWVTGVT